MIRHCTDTFSPTTNWLAHLDVDEFITQSPTLYGPSAPYSPSASSSTADAPTTATIKDWQYPLHDLLARPTNVDSACIPIPGAFKYRNVGVRTLAEGQGVLDTQTARDVVHHGTLPEKVSRLESRFDFSLTALRRSSFILRSVHHSSNSLDRIRVASTKNRPLRECRGRLEIRRA